MSKCKHCMFPEKCSLNWEFGECYYYEWLELKRDELRDEYAVGFDGPPNDGEEDVY